MSLTLFVRDGEREEGRRREPGCPRPGLRPPAAAPAASPEEGGREPVASSASCLGETGFKAHLGAFPPPACSSFPSPCWAQFSRRSGSIAFLRALQERARSARHKLPAKVCWWYKVSLRRKPVTDCGGWIPSVRSCGGLGATSRTTPRAGSAVSGQVCGTWWQSSWGCSIAGGSHPARRKQMRCCARPDGRCVLRIAGKKN